MDRERCPVGSRDEGLLVIPKLGMVSRDLGERGEVKRRNGKGREVGQLTSRHWYPSPSEFHALAQTGRRVKTRSGGQSPTDQPLTCIVGSFGRTRCSWSPTIQITNPPDAASHTHVCAGTGKEGNKTTHEPLHFSEGSRMRNRGERVVPRVKPNSDVRALSISLTATRYPYLQMKLGNPGLSTTKQRRVLWYLVCGLTTHKRLILPSSDAVANESARKCRRLQKSGLGSPV